MLFARRPDMHPGYFMPAILLLVGLPFVLAALWLAVDEGRFRAQGQRVAGTVVDRKGSAPSLVVEYAAPDGRRHRIESFGSDLHDGYQIGAPVGVFMDPARPESGRMDLFTTSWMVPLILGVFGSFFALPGALFLRGALRSPLRRQQASKQTQPMLGRVLEVTPTLSMDAMRRRPAGSGNFELSLSREDDGWHMTVNGEERDPFAPEANADHGVQYIVEAEWTDPQTGRTHQAMSEPCDVDPRPLLASGTVTVLMDPEDPENCRVELPWARMEE